jgi:hypothetical protein
MPRTTGDEDMPRTTAAAIERVLKELEFPGEDGRAFAAFVSSSRLAENVMRSVLAAPGRSRRAVLWAAFAAANLTLLAVLGTNDSIRALFFGLQQALVRFFFLFLAMSAMGAIFGFILSIDTRWFSRWARRRI